MGKHEQQQQQKTDNMKKRNKWVHNMYVIKN